MRLRSLAPALAWILMVTGCAGGGGGEYDPNWDMNGPIEDGKADGFLDMAPELELGGSADGDVGGDRMEIFLVELRRTDRIAVEMEVTDGDLNPHVSLIWGTSSYIHSDSWSRDDNVLRKEYTAEDAGRYVIAARAYRGEGNGSYRISAECLGGPCNGEAPPQAA